jgi:hypothetical protein
MTRHGADRTYPNERKFFGSFFQKKNTFLSPPLRRARYTDLSLRIF